MSDELIEKVAYAIFREHDMHGVAFEGRPYEVSMKAARAALQVIDEDKGDPVTDPSTLKVGDVVSYLIDGKRKRTNVTGYEDGDLRSSAIPFLTIEGEFWDEISDVRLVGTEIAS